MAGKAVACAIRGYILNPTSDLWAPWYCYSQDRRIHDWYRIA